MLGQGASLFEVNHHDGDRGRGNTRYPRSLTQGDWLDDGEFFPELIGKAVYIGVVEIRRDPYLLQILELLYLL